MSKWLMVLGGAASAAVGVWLIVFFAPQVLVFLQGVVGILAGLAGGILLFVGISELRE